MTDDQTTLNSYEERQKAKAERYAELASKAESASQAAYNQSGRIADNIPFGQPILIGHHSEARARRDHEKIVNLMDKSIEESKKAEYYKNKAENALNPSGISSDNPDAIRLLKEKLAALEAIREQMKKINKIHAEFLKNPESLKTSGLTEETQEKIKNYTPRYSWEPHPYPPYKLTNLNGNMKRIKERIAHLESVKAVPEIDETINGIRVFIDKYENRVKVVFPDIPSEAIRSELKHSGFRWSPRARAWQAYINQWNLDNARKIAKGPNQEASE